MKITLTPTKLIGAAAAGLLGLSGLAVAGALPGGPERPSVAETTELPAQADTGLERAEAGADNANRGDDTDLGTLDVDAQENGEPNENAEFGQSVAERAQAGEPQAGGEFGQSVAEEASGERSTAGADAAEAGPANADRADAHRDGAGTQADGAGNQAGDRRPESAGKPEGVGGGDEDDDE